MKHRVKIPVVLVRDKIGTNEHSVLLENHMLKYEQVDSIHYEWLGTDLSDLFRNFLSSYNRRKYFGKALRPGQKKRFVVTVEEV